MSAPKLIGLFSSDFTTLYKGDIFRVLALPTGYVLQFRYDYKYVPDAFRQNIRLLSNREAVVFFTAGNDPDKPPAELNLVHHPLRSCRIRTVRDSKNTQQIILFIELGAFVNCKISELNQTPALPPAKFVAELELADKRDIDWLDRVHDIKDSFAGVLFYHLTLLKNDAVVAPIYDEGKQMSYFSLEEESEYVVECDCYDPTGGKNKLGTESQLTNIYFTNLFDSGVGAEKDSRRLPFTTGILSNSGTVPSFFHFFSSNLSSSRKFAEDPNAVSIYLRLSRSCAKAPIFGCLTGMVALGVLFTQFAYSAATASQTITTDQLVSEMFVRAIGLILIIFGAGFLYRFFNKT